MSHDGCVARSGYRNVPVSWSVASRTTAWPTRPASTAGDLIVSAGGKAIADADDLFEALGTLKVPFELVLVRGTEERTVTIG